MPQPFVMTDVNDVPIGTAGNPLVTSNSGGGATNLATNQVSVAATATLIVAARTGRSSVLVVNPSSVIVYVGPTNGVTTANGVPVQAGGWVTFDTASAIYGISASGTNTVAYAETY